ncbi:hypothetical protein AVEN_23847-1 [Araneus ventricosus]|uniref:Uncharacterized protein n=1 Tax=Araneus ventricosus TaxID=182803 RepID=A0A4Y2SI37_ARAVE|nr:hypothetical protein AVEN_230423-1 [Araneus ventricosus]GBN87892.1 hypothetical protein AVEN_23847-1 [Araneus ventricosus]
MAIDFARWEGPICPTGGHGLPEKGARPAVWGDEWNEIGLKFLPDYYLSTTVEYPVQKFSPMGGPSIPGPLASPLHHNMAEYRTPPMTQYLKP